MKIQKCSSVYKYQMLSFLSGLTNFQHQNFEADPSQLLICLNIMKSSFSTGKKIPHASHTSVYLLLTH